MSTTTALEFRRRSKRHETDTASRRIWTDTTGRYRVVESRSKYDKTHKGHPRVDYYAQVAYHPPGAPTFVICWDRITTHRTAKAAENACQAHHAK